MEHEEIMEKLMYSSHEEKAKKLSFYTVLDYISMAYLYGVKPNKIADMIAEHSSFSRMQALFMVMDYVHSYGASDPHDLKKRMNFSIKKAAYV